MIGEVSTKEEGMTTTLRGNIGEILEGYARTQPSAPALMAPGDRALNYAALAEQIHYVRKQLNEWRIGQGDIVAAVVVSRPAFALACLTFCCSTTFGPLSPNLTVDAYLGVLRRLRPRVVVLECAQNHPVRQAIGALGVTVIELRIEPNEPAGSFTLGKMQDAAATGMPYRCDRQWAFVLMTSGTTGSGKIVPLSHEVVIRNADALGGCLTLKPADVSSHLMPMHSPHGLRVALLTPILRGSSVAVLTESDTSGFFRTLLAYGVTWVSASFTLIKDLGERASEFRDVARHHRLRFVRCGSGTLTPEEIDKIENHLRCPVVAGYSASECGTITHDGLPPFVRKRGAVGLPLFNEVMVCGQDGTPGLPGKLGEILVRGPSVFDGYFDDPIVTAEAFREGWYRTGDLGEFDNDGYLYIRGRIKEVINRGGETVLPAEIDAAIQSIPGVGEAAAFAVPHSRLGDELVAAVVRSSGSEIDAAHIRSALLRKVGRRAVPRQIYFLDRLPRTDAGKIKRQQLAQEFGPLKSSDSVTPRTAVTPLQVALESMWRTLLSTDRMDVNDDFFLLGGDSLLGARLLTQVKEVFGAELAIETLFTEASTVAGMASEIEKLRSSRPI